MMTRTDFENVSKLINTHLNKNPKHYTALVEFAEDFCDLALANNSRFNSDRFMQACGFEKVVDPGTRLPIWIIADL